MKVLLLKFRLPVEKKGMFKIRMETAPFVLAPKAVFFITQWSSQLLHIITYTHIQKKKTQTKKKPQTYE